MKEAKKKYDSVLADIESSRGNIEREVNKIRRHHTDRKSYYEFYKYTVCFMNIIKHTDVSF